MKDPLFILDRKVNDHKNLEVLRLEAIVAGISFWEGEDEDKFAE